MAVGVIAVGRHVVGGIAILGVGSMCHPRGDQVTIWGEGETWRTWIELNYAWPTLQLENNINHNDLDAWFESKTYKLQSS
jgi:hypothetical protein